LFEIKKRIVSIASYGGVRYGTTCHRASDRIVFSPPNLSGIIALNAAYILAGFRTIFYIFRGRLLEAPRSYIAVTSETLAISPIQRRESETSTAAVRTYESV